MLNRINKLLRSFGYASFMGIAYPSYKKFKNALQHISEVQQSILFSNIRCNSNTIFGKHHNFERIRTISDFQNNVPIRQYKDFEPWIQKILAGENNVLTYDKVFLLHPTSGSDSANKFIPYNQTLQKEFQKAVIPWLYSLYRKHPNSIRGKSYWSVSPIQPETFISKEVPIGYMQDEKYLGIFGSLQSLFFAIPSALRTIKDIKDFQYALALFLVAEESLSLISVWSPTYLMLLCKLIETECERISKDLMQGSVSLLNSPVPKIISKFFKPHKKRQLIFKNFLSEGKMDFSQLWPSLDLISCWKDGPSAYYIPYIQKYFPETTIQGKGLLATEGVISIPFEDFQGHVPACSSHFLEFQNENNEVYLLHQIRKGESYKVILTTGGGLYRYALNDIITVSDIKQGVPLINFESRDQVSDLAGEKLHVVFLTDALNKVSKLLSMRAIFMIFSRRGEKNSRGYIIYWEPEQNDSSLEQLKKLESNLEEELLKNYHYAYARKIGQLDRLRLFLIEKDGQKNYSEACYKNNMQIGTIKPGIIDIHNKCHGIFRGDFLDNLFQGKRQ